LLPQSWQVENSLLNKIKFIETKKLNKYRDTGLQSLGAFFPIFGTPVVSTAGHSGCAV
jgi:hypothetical protein